MQLRRLRRTPYRLSAALGLTAVVAAACSSGAGVQTASPVLSLTPEAAATSTAPVDPSSGGSTAGTASAAGGVSAAPDTSSGGSAASGPATTADAVPARGTVPPLLDARDVYAADRPNALSPVVRGFRNLVYVPNSESDTVSVIDPATYKVVDTYKVGDLPQHVVPSWDLKTLWVNNNKGNTLTPIDPTTGKPGNAVPVEDPYNLYFTPDGTSALVMAERNGEIDLRDPQTMAKTGTIRACKGVNHADFSADGSYFVATCEFSNQLIKVDLASRQVVGRITLQKGSMPQDVKLSPDGSLFYVADMQANGVHVIDAATFTKTGFLPTGKQAHGLYVSRDSKTLYVTNRGEGSVSLIDLGTRAVTGKWQIPGGGSPDMGGVSADSKVLWLTGRYDAEVYALSTTDGRLLARIPVGKGPHGLAVYPQPGRYSLGHTGIFR